MTSQQRPHRPLYPGINARIIAPFLLVIIVIAGLGGFIMTRLVAGSIQERFANQLIDSAYAASNSIVDIERQQIATLRLMVFTEGVPEAVYANDTTSLDQWLRPVAANAKIDRMIVFDHTGQGMLQLVLSDEFSLRYESTTPPADLSNWAGVQRVITGQADILGDKYVDVIGEPPHTTFYFAAPVVNEAGAVIGGISVGLNAANLAQRVSQQSLSGVTLYTERGIVLGTTFLSAPASELSLTTEKAKSLMTTITDTSPVEEWTFNAAPYQVMFAPFKLRSQPIGLMAVSLRSNFLVERSSSSRDLIGSLFAVLFVVVAILGLVTARTITRPIARLVETTRAIRTGDLSRRVGLETPDELGELGVSFDHMTEELVQRNEEINELYLQQLHETAQREAVLSSISDAVIVQNPIGKIIMTNGTAERLLTIASRDEDIRREFMQLTRQPDNLMQPKTVSFAGQFFSVLATRVCTETGDFLGHVIIFRDITALLEAEKMKDELILQMSHELRTPLTAARGYVDLVRMVDQDTLSEQSRGFMQIAVDSMSTLERMVNQVIDVSTIVSNRFALEMEEFDLAELVQEQVDIWRPIMQQREHRLSVVASPDGIPMYADSHRIGQVLDHLLRNAYSFTLPGGDVQIEVSSSNSRALIAVADTGVGIDEDEIEKVFERLYRGRSADAGPTDARGLGLGLYLSRRIIEAHQGTIMLKSRVNQGTTVIVGLPLRPQVEVQMRQGIAEKLGQY